MCLDFARGYCPNGEEVGGRERERRNEGENKLVSISYFISISVYKAAYCGLSRILRER